MNPLDIQSSGIPNEQLRYYSRLKNSMEKQGYFYNQHLNNVFIPEKLKTSAFSEGNKSAIGLLGKGNYMRD